MSSDFQVICGTMVRKNRGSPVSTETPDQWHASVIHASSFF